MQNFPKSSGAQRFDFGSTKAALGEETFAVLSGKLVRRIGFSGYYHSWQIPDGNPHPAPCYLMAGMRRAPSRKMP